jgi:hypothetical protein
MKITLPATRTRLPVISVKVLFEYITSPEGISDVRPAGHRESEDQMKLDIVGAGHVAITLAGGWSKTRLIVPAIG